MHIMIKKIAGFNYESLALFAFALATSFTVLGPVFHYTGWGIALLALIYGKIKYNANLFGAVDKSSKCILGILLLYLVWSMFANAFTADSFYYWGKSASVPLELLISITLAIRLLNKEAGRRKFAIVFLTINTLIVIGLIIIEAFNIVSPLHGLLNQNIIGLYSVIVMPVFFCTAFWFCKNSLCRVLLLSVSSLLIITSFSSGPLLTATLQGIIIIFYAIREKHLDFKLLTKCFVVLLISLIGLNFISGDKVLPRFKQEFEQIFAINDTDSFTSKRNRAWSATFFMIKQRPILGHGRALFNKRYDDNLQAFIKNDIVKADEIIYAHPHSMYLGSLFDSGVLGLVLILLAFIFSIRKAWILLHRSCTKKEIVPWAVLGLSLLVGQLLYGIIGDIFESRNDIAPIFWAFWGILLSLSININDDGLTHTPVQQDEDITKETSCDYSPVQIQSRC